MRIKREEGSMIKNEDGTLIKDEDTERIKSEDDGFWGKKEEGVDEQDSKDMVKVGTSESGGAPKSEIKDSHSNLQIQATSFGQKGADEPENVYPVDTTHCAAPYLRLPQMEVGPKCNDYGYEQHIPAHLANFRAYGHANTSDLYAREQNDSVKSEYVDSNNTNYYSTPFNGYSPIPRPDIFKSFAQVSTHSIAQGEPESTYSNSRATPRSSVDSSFRSDMINMALTTPTASKVETRPTRQEHVNYVMGLPTIKDDVSETASDKYYSSSIARQSYHNNNLG